MGGRGWRMFMVITHKGDLCLVQIAVVLTMVDSAT